MLRKITFAVMVSFAAVGCSSTPLSKVGGDGALPTDLPKEMQEKFEIKDAEKSPFPSPFQSALTNEETAGAKKLSPSAKPAKKQKVELKKKLAKGKKGEAAVEPKAPEPAPFVFPQRRPPVEPIWVSESQTYDVSYFGVSAGDFTLTVLPPKQMNSRKVYHVRGNAVSSSVFSVFYRLNDMVESFFDYDGYFSHRFHILLDETKQTRDSLELNDSEKGQTYYWNRWNRPHAGYVETKEFQPIAPFSQDSLSALYYLRSQPLRDGDVVTFPVVSEGKTWEAVVTVLRREMMSTPLGKIRTIVLQPDHKYQGVLKKNGDSYIWLSDDDRKILVRLEAKVRIGTVVAMLKSAVQGTPPAAPDAPAAASAEGSALAPATVSP